MRSPSKSTPHFEIYNPTPNKKKAGTQIQPGSLPTATEESQKQPDPFPLIQWSDMQKQLHPYYGVVSGVYYAMTGMPWLSSDARKAVKTEWFWQPIRGQPRRVDTNELRKYSNTVWVQSIVMTVLNQVTNVPWDIVPIEEDTPYEAVEDEINRVKDFLKSPNKNEESWEDIVKTWIKDVEEIDAGVLVKVFSIDSYDFEHLEPRSGAPLLKPLHCPECKGTGKIPVVSAKEKAMRVLDSVTKAERELPDAVAHPTLKETSYKLTKPDYGPCVEKMQQIVSTKPAPGLLEMPCPFCEGTGTGRRMAEIYCLDGASFLKDSDRTGWTYGYWQYSYAIPAHPMWFNRDEIIYYMANPRGLSVYGYSPMQSSLEAVKALEYSMKHNMSLFIDGAVPDGIVSVEDMSNEELKRMKGAWENELKGQPHKVVFLNKKTTFSPFAFNNRDMQFLEGQKETWKQVMANFGVSPSDLGVFEDVSRATAGTAAEMGRRKAIRPILSKIEQMVNRHILPELGAKSVKYKYVVSDPVEERMKAELNQLYITAGIKSVNEIRIEMGLPPTEWGDGPSNQLGFLQPQGRRPGEETGIEDTVEATQAGPLDAQEKAYQYPFQAQVPFVTTIQGLSTPVPWALPKREHINTQEPYSAASGLCPGCGKQTLMPVGQTPDRISVNRWYQCQACHREFTEAQLSSAVKEQERMHETGERTDSFVRATGDLAEINDVLAPKVVQDIQTLQTMTPNAPLPNLVPTAQAKEPPVLDSRTGKYRPYGTPKTEGERRERHRERHGTTELPPRGTGRLGKKTKSDLKKKVETLGGDFSVDLDAWLGFQSAPLYYFVEGFLEDYKFDQVKTSAKKRKALKNIFTEAFFSGMNMPQLAGEIEAAGFGPKEAESIARTETIRIANESKLLQAKASDHKKVIFTATKDDITCPECMALDGKTMGIKKAQGIIPIHPHCRCTWRISVV